MRLLIYLVLLAQSSLSFANVLFIESLNDVYYRGEHQQLGGLGIRFEGDDFPLASRESPVYLRVSFRDPGIVLSETVVDFSSLVSSVNRPLYLPLASDRNGAAGLEVLAPADTLSIVRWVAGESEIWLRIQSSTSSWLRLNGTATAPSRENSVFTTLGVSARWLTTLLSERQKNLAFPTRDLVSEDPSFSESVLFCVDLTRSNLEPNINRDSYVSYFPDFFAADAQLSPGRYAPGTPFSVRIYNNGDLARANAWAGQGKLLSLRTALPAFAEQSSLTLSATCRLSTAGRTHTFDEHFHAGSRLTLSIPASLSLGFVSAAFELPGQPAGRFLPDHTSAFELEGQTLYRTIHLEWSGDSLSMQAEIPLIALVRGVPPSEPSALALQYRLEQASHVAVQNQPPFDGPRQQDVCQPYLKLLDSGSWLPFEKATSAMLVHLTRSDAGFQSEVILVNARQEPMTAMLQPYAADGSALSAVQLPVAAGQTLVLPAQSLFQSEPVASCRVLHSQDELQVLVQYKAIQPGSVPAVSAAKTLASQRRRFLLGDPSLNWDGAALLNRGGTPARVTARVLSADGVVLAESLLAEALLPNAKQLVLLSQLFPVAGAIVEVEADLPLDLVALRGDLASQFLWENPTVSLSP